MGPNINYNEMCSSRTGIIQTPHRALVYVRAVRSGKERPDTSRSKEKSTSHGYKYHQTAQGMAANEVLAAASTEPLSLCYPPSACKNAGRVDANASHALVACPSGGRNCPQVPSALPHLNYLGTSLKVHLCTRLRGFTHQCKTYALLHIAY